MNIYSITILLFILVVTASGQFCKYITMTAWTAETPDQYYSCTAPVSQYGFGNCQNSEGYSLSVSSFSSQSNLGPTGQISMIDSSPYTTDHEIESCPKESKIIKPRYYL
ncbi:hypothetical protein PPL_05405 [Heterostelium album PN500]|uniref:Secreted protein n=1 Tax=Heterostelium pallidum (strain ATCC 26659 / Pp 5 / PN500) TaxID=670386 RepID=D3BA32_HETP5|nr:hypothetical protein PPL_05405 [Heterostelium album PN500]EFA81419.1 hypothetical protein PPL_05405 [Heterostelium album PN500]|eukprot:XP_020433537.1 hypothetical protein PPL_05405 [Heterostelium album PN500]